MKIDISKMSSRLCWARDKKMYIRVQWKSRTWPGLDVKCIYYYKRSLNFFDNGSWKLYFILKKSLSAVLEIDLGGHIKKMCDMKLNAAKNNSATTFVTLI